MLAKHYETEAGSPKRYVTNDKQRDEDSGREKGTEEMTLWNCALGRVGWCWGGTDSAQVWECTALLQTLCLF